MGIMSLKMEEEQTQNWTCLWIKGWLWWGQQRNNNWTVHQAKRRPRVGAWPRVPRPSALNFQSDHTKLFGKPLRFVLYSRIQDLLSTIMESQDKKTIFYELVQENHWWNSKKIKNWLDIYKHWIINWFCWKGH